MTDARASQINAKQGTIKAQNTILQGNNKDIIYISLQLCKMNDARASHINA
jgi:hypothetical protein